MSRPETPLRAQAVHILEEVINLSGGIPYQYEACIDAIEAFAKRVQEEEREACATTALEQRCERNTPWDSACLTIATAIRKRGGQG